MRTNKSRSGKTVRVAAQAPRPRRAVPVERRAPRHQTRAPNDSQGQVAHKPPPPQPPLRIPAILLQGDRLASPLVKGPARREGLEPATPTGHGQPRPEERELPEAYGTGNLLLAARDPHWLYAHWDLTDQQQRRYNARAADHHLVLRVHPDRHSGQPMQEISLQPESRHWFIRVERAGTRYAAELGYYHRDRQWSVIATSAVVATPVDAVAGDRTVRWATFAARVLPPQPDGQGQGPRSVARRQPGPDLVSPGFSGPGPQAEFPASPLHGVQPEAPADWTPARERALANVVRQALSGHKQTGSAEVAQLIQSEAEQEFPPSAILGISSLEGGAPPPAGFRFSLHAELIIHGATEANAQVMLGGQPVQLRPDGTFRCRFALPDGRYHLNAAAISARNELRQAEFTFTRRTDYDGAVGANPRDQALTPPRV